jgi:predicted small metal-binding protein
LRVERRGRLSAPSILGRGVVVAKTYACHDSGMDCDWSTTAETVEEVMTNINEHALEAHGIKQIPNEMADRIRGRIKTA